MCMFFRNIQKKMNIQRIIGCEHFSRRAFLPHKNATKISTTEILLDISVRHCSVIKMEKVGGRWWFRPNTG